MPATPPPGSSDPYVDYDRVATDYRRGRRLEAERLAPWRDAVRERLVDGSPPARVLDVGSGPGTFAAAWLDWGAGLVVGVEPSEAMRAATEWPRGRGLCVVGGRAEHLPLVPRAVDVVWMSAVIHHLADLGAAAGEAHRVLRPGGTLFVRGFFPDHSTVAWLDLFPGAERSQARFPTTTEAVRAFSGAGLELHDIVGVPEGRSPRGDEVAEWIGRMRTADTLLTALSDDEVAAGLAELRRDPPPELAPMALTLLTFGRRGDGPPGDPTSAGRPSTAVAGWEP